MAKLTVQGCVVAVVAVAVLFMLLCVQPGVVEAGCDQTALTQNLLVCQKYLNTQPIGSDCCDEMKSLWDSGSVDGACICQFVSAVGPEFHFTPAVAETFIATCVGAMAVPACL